MSRGAARLRRDQRGLTLIELLIAATLGLVVVGGALTMFMGAVRSEPRTAGKVSAIQQARTTIDRITRELRQGREIPTTPSASQLAIVTWVKASNCGGPAATSSILCRVTYSCAGTVCTRTVAQPDGAAPGPASQVAAGLVSADVFSYLPDAAEPTYVGVSFSVGAGESAPVTLGDGVALRNPSEEA